MYKIFDFRCPDGHLFEKMVEGQVTTCRCSCGKEATRQLSAPAFHLEGHSGDFPGRHMKWVKEHEKAGRNNHLHNE
jgi:hypothetical protein